MWHALFKNVNYLNIVSKKNQIDENESLNEHKTKMMTKLNKNNENRTKYIFNHILN